MSEAHRHHPAHAHPVATGGPELGGLRRAPHAAAHEVHTAEAFRRRFWISLALTLPILLYAQPLQQWLSYRVPQFPGAEHVPFVLGTVLFFYGGAIFLRGAVDELRRRLPGMMTLVALAITVAYVYSVAVTLFVPGEPLYWELATLITVMLLGHWMEMEAVGRARGALQELARLLPDTAERLVDGQVERVPVDALRAEDVVLIRPGGRVPADGTVVEGESSVDEAAITGESRPVPKAPGDTVIGGTVNGEGALRVRITRTGAETTLGRMMHLVEEAQASRTRTQVLADRAASWLTLIAVVTGTLTFALWAISPRPLGFAFERTVTVLVITCPHALGLAIPLVVSISTALAARNGLLVRDRLALEAARDIDVVLFDKTGTLTRAEHRVTRIYPVGTTDPNQALALAAATEANSEHMLARALVESARERGLAIPPAEEFQAIPGRGVRAHVGGRAFHVGGPRLLEGLGVSLPPELEPALATTQDAGESLVYLLEDSSVRAAFALRDVVREESREAVQALHAMGVQVALITGDSEAVARRVVTELGIREYYAQVLPEEKSRKVAELRRQGRRVAMVGDGVNDAPALAAADVGIAIGAGTDVAVEAGGVILVRNDPRDVARIIQLSRASYRKMLQNLAWATGYNIIALPLAAGVLANQGIVLPPALAAVFMSASTVIVAINAQLLRRVRL
ncbi:MAG: heavy metal translocating P-type ATPase [Armatimonadetes bacterium]|nr:heavy metal translocating P-type ATPase [Armatimonadota bacterium]